MKPLAVVVVLGGLCFAAWPRPLEAQGTCASSGYYCAHGNTRPVARWPDDRRALRILLPAPPHETASQARRYQQAAARGLMSWHGLPLELMVFEQGDPAEMDIIVEWQAQLDDGRIGETLVATGRSGNESTFRIARFVLATRPPASVIQKAQEEAAAAAEAAGEEVPEELPPLPPDVLDRLSMSTVEITAIHEMGHALGLPHSDSESDVMYPELTGARVSRRDVTTVQALYATPIGTRVR